MYVSLWFVKEKQNKTKQKNRHPVCVCASFDVDGEPTMQFWFAERKGENYSVASRK